MNIVRRYAARAGAQDILYCRAFHDKAPQKRTSAPRRRVAIMRQPRDLYRDRLRLQHGYCFFVFDDTHALPIAAARDELFSL